MLCVSNALNDIEINIHGDGLQTRSISSAIDIAEGISQTLINKNKLNYNAVGASGAVMGIVYASILLNPSMTLFFFIIPMPGYLFGIGYLFYSIYSMKKRNDNIGHEAHLGGAIAGFFTTLLISPIVLINNMFTVAVLLIPIVYFYIKTNRIW